eukprot:TRINITY_DN4506_c0_g4_i2.p1 TRINITY_DN4506_c0_g4~~TRINITY_DN4506_c0_g4_i2.p1  ORF type:complete len:193 (+),score=31.58 TRINITY_DN4506_c0_g4_i2:154-732(+)
MDNLLPANNVKDFNLKDIEQPMTFIDFRSIVGALHYNDWFTSVTIREARIDNLWTKVISDMIGTNSKLEELVLSDVGIHSQGLEMIAGSISQNPNTSLTSIDWSNSDLQDKGAAALGKTIGSLSHGLGSLNIASGQVTKKGMKLFLTGLVSNTHMGKTLSILDLSNNKLDSDGSATLGQFLSTPNVVPRTLR